MLLKEVYNQKFIKNLANQLYFFEKNFLKNVFQKSLSQEKISELSLKQRMRLITIKMNESLPNLRYSEKISLFKKAVKQLSHQKYSSLSLIIFPDFVEVFGQDDFENSMLALEFFTEFGTSEFAVRKFIKIDQNRALVFFKKWSESKNYHVRRLASEGIRPLLPWGENLQSFKKNPLPILKILENLKNDDSEYVKKSVANNLNDISKNHPEIVLATAKKWQKDVDEKLIKQSLRTLLKKGDKKALEIIGIKSSKNFLIKDFNLKRSQIKFGENLEFNFNLENQIENQKLRLEYVIFYLKKNGTHSKKIFQITTKKILKGLFNFSKKQPFVDLTTRRHYQGQHFISLVINGIELGKKEFFLI
jgi:3-methyladenine DNA glycosylase AlkC